LNEDVFVGIDRHHDIGKVENMLQPPAKFKGLDKNGMFLLQEGHVKYLMKYMDDPTKVVSTLLKIYKNFL